MMKNILYHNDKAYVVLRTLKVHQVSNPNGLVNMEALKAWRDYLGGDHVIKQNDSYMILEAIQDIDYEEIVYTDELVK
tara:strand:- start:231 stop:464 length:234 start_codon:yes stop_codon:yes gene_type:complete